MKAVMKISKINLDYKLTDILSSGTKDPASSLQVFWNFPNSRHFLYRLAMNCGRFHFLLDQFIIISQRIGNWGLRE